jgi:hypothetical protein
MLCSGSLCARAPRASRQSIVTTIVTTLLVNSGSPPLWPLLGVAAGLYFFFRGFFLLQRKRLIQNTPISKVRSASLGLLEVSGLAVGPYTMTAPITSVACYCYRTVAWQEKGSGKDRSWEMVAEEKLHVPFFLDDNTGTLLVDPTGAELDLHRDFRQEFSDSIFSTDSPAPANVRNFLFRHGVSGDVKTRIEEFCIKPKNFLFILGTLAENPGLAVAPRTTPTQKQDGFESSLLSMSPLAPDFSVPMFAKPTTTVAWSEPAAGVVVDLTGALPPNSTAQMTQQAKIAAALQRAGIVTPDLRSLVEPDPAARVQPAVNSLSSPANGQSSSVGKVPASEFDLKPPVVLMKGKNDNSFLISWRDQRQVVSSMRWKSTLMIWGGPALMLVSLYLVAAEFGWL